MAWRGRPQERVRSPRVQSPGQRSLPQGELALGSGQELTVREPRWTHGVRTGLRPAAGPGADWPPGVWTPRELAVREPGWTPGVRTRLRPAAGPRVDRPPGVRAPGASPRTRGSGIRRLGSLRTGGPGRGPGSSRLLKALGALQEELAVRSGSSRSSLESRLEELDRWGLLPDELLTRRQLGRLGRLGLGRLRGPRAPWEEGADPRREELLWNLAYSLEEDSPSAISEALRNSLLSSAFLREEEEEGEGSGEDPRSGPPEALMESPAAEDQARADRGVEDRAPEGVGLSLESGGPEGPRDLSGDSTPGRPSLKRSREGSDGGGRARGLSRQASRRVEIARESPGDRDRSKAWSTPLGLDLVELGGARETGRRPCRRAPVHARRKMGDREVFLRAERSGGSA